MTVLWFLVSILVLVVWVLTIIDIVRRHYPVGTMIGWIALTIVLPFIGSAIYWATRKPTGREAEAEYLAEADMRRSTASKGTDRTL